MVSWLSCFLCFTSSVSLKGSYTEDWPFKFTAPGHTMPRCELRWVHMTSFIWKAITNPLVLVDVRAFCWYCWLWYGGGIPETAPLSISDCEDALIAFFKFSTFKRDDTNFNYAKITFRPTVIEPVTSPPRSLATSQLATQSSSFLWPKSGVSIKMWWRGPWWRNELKQNLYTVPRPGPSCGKSIRSSPRDVLQTCSVVSRLFRSPIGCFANDSLSPGSSNAKICWCKGSTMILQ